MIDRLLAQGALAADEEDYLDVLSDLVEKYEDQRYPIEPVSGLDALRHLIRRAGLAGRGDVRKIRDGGEPFRERRVGIEPFRFGLAHLFQHALARRDHLALLADVAEDVERVGIRFSLRQQAPDIARSPGSRCRSAGRLEHAVHVGAADGRDTR